MSRLQITILAAGLLGGLLMSAACDRKWDFECTATWSEDGVEVWRKVYTYPEMDTEQAATARCKEEMLAARPKRANSAICKCVGQD
ncbi:hypothetical protein [Enhygromyxa salina]|uniref:hypothetical protein n=1 Tax=Enhygromyxa salina TaxID=215803 RepID=UPI0011B28A3F|nr:hypothetical protein [Enhygromyxa salina]